jgi:hypothetical protein
VPPPSQTPDMNIFLAEDSADDPAGPADGLGQDAWAAFFQSKRPFLFKVSRLSNPGHYTNVATIHSSTLQGVNKAQLTLGHLRKLCSQM